MSKYIHTLLATLGGQPQVVTFTLDLLLQRGFPISEVILVHPEASYPRLQHSLDCLNAEFVGDRYQVSGQTIHHLIRSLKRQHRCIHLSITGGRRLMSSIATEAALLNFTHSDHIWHIYTPEAVQRQVNEGTLMHISPQDGVHLIERHFVPWGTYFSDLSQTINTAQEAIHSQKRKMDTLEQARCDQVVQQSTERQLDVLRAFSEGLNIQEVAERLCITARTVDAHKTKLLELCREVWTIEQSVSRLGYHFLYKTFAPYFDSHPE